MITDPEKRNRALMRLGTLRVLTHIPSRRHELVDAVTSPSADLVADVRSIFDCTESEARQVLNIPLELLSPARQNDLLVELDELGRALEGQ